MTGALVVLGALAATLAIGLLYRWRNGRVRPAAPASSQERQPLPAEALEIIAAHGGSESGTITLLQLSTTFCAPCRHTKVLLTDLVSGTPWLRHVEIDLTERAELTSALKVYRTPTTLVLDDRLRELFRISGLPKRAELTETLHSLRDVSGR